MPKITGTRKEKAEKLLERLTRGPAFSSLPYEQFSPAQATEIFQRWSRSWILEDLKSLVPELRNKPEPVRYFQPKASLMCYQGDTAVHLANPALRMTLCELSVGLRGWPQIHPSEVQEENVCRTCLRRMKNELDSDGKY